MLEKLLKILLVVILVTPSLALGAVHPTVTGVYGLLASILGAAVLFSKELRRPPLDIPGVVLLGLTLFTAFQLTPLPAGLVEIISPATFEIRARALRPLEGPAPEWMPLTLDTALTTVELCKILVLLIVYFTVAGWCRHRGSRLVLRSVVGAGAAGAVVFLVHKLLMLESVYGVYDPVHVRTTAERLSAPLVNENHLGGLLAIGAITATGLALRAQSRSSRFLMLGLTSLMGGALLLTLSRGAIIAFVAGQLVFLTLRLAHRMRKGSDDDGGQLRWAPLVLIMSVGLGLFAAQDAILGEFVNGTTQKVEIAEEGLKLAARFPAAGVGRGAFWVAFPLVNDLPRAATFSHAENIVVQLLADYGPAVGGAAILAMILFVGFHLVSVPRKPQHAASLAALAAFGVHNLVDFNSEVLGVAVLPVALLASLRPTRKPRGQGTPVPRPVTASAAVAAALVALTVIFHTAGHTIDEERRTYRKAWAQKDPEPFSRQALTAALSRHPADWYIPFITGVRELQRSKGKPLPFLARALEVDPHSPSAHFYVGKALLSSGNTSQAKVELRLAARENSTFARHAARLLVRKVPSFLELADLGTTPDEQELLWDALARGFEETGNAEEAAAADEALLRSFPDHAPARLRSANRALRGDDPQTAVSLLERVPPSSEQGAEAAVVLARAHEKLGNIASAKTVLAGALEDNPDHPSVLRALALVELASGDHDRAVATASRLRALAKNSRARAAAVMFEADIELRAGRRQQAIARLREAHALAPSLTAPLNKLISIAQQDGNQTTLIDALTKLTAVDPDNKAAAKMLEDIRQRQLEKAILGR